MSYTITTLCNLLYLHLLIVDPAAGILERRAHRLHRELQRGEAEHQLHQRGEQLAEVHDCQRMGDN